jgi:hypothetical protein
LEQALRKLAVKLETSGTATLIENTKLYKGCYAFVWLQALVPATQNRTNGTAPLCTVHGVVTDTFGNRRQLGESHYNMIYAGHTKLGGFDYLVFERLMPKPLTDTVGDLDLVFNCSEITGYGDGYSELSSRLSSSVLHTAVEEGGEADGQIVVAVNSQEAAQINQNTINVELLKDGLSELGEAVGGFAGVKRLSGIDLNDVVESGVYAYFDYGAMNAHYADGIVLVSGDRVNEVARQYDVPFDYPLRPMYTRSVHYGDGTVSEWAAQERPLYPDSIEQGTGNSASLVMSQKAATDAINEANTATAAERDRATAAELTLAARIAAQEGLGGYLTHHDFGTAEPTQDDLTDYALEQIGITDPSEIFNGTRVENDFDGQTWELVNTPTTEPPVFSWEPMSGIARVAPFTNAAAGVIKGSGDDGAVGAQADGTGRVNGWDALSDTADTALSVAQGASTEVTQEAARAQGAEAGLQEGITANAGAITDLQEAIDGIEIIIGVI